MFSGIVAGRGRIGSLSRRSSGARLAIVPQRGFGRFEVGQSVSVSGVCLTAISSGPRFVADLSGETLTRTTLGNLRVGSVVNLERAVQPTQPLCGHLVQGHVDGVGEVCSIQKGGEAWTFWFRIPARHRRYVVEKGSIAIDGVSLTVAVLRRDRFAAAVVPHTYRVTTLSRRSPGDAINYELDIIAKYVEALAASYLS